MALSVGQVLRGRFAEYHITKILKMPTVYQARIVPFDQDAKKQTLHLPQLAVIKHFPSDLSKTQYKRELHNYTFESIAESSFIRSMLDLIGHQDELLETSEQPQCMVFEWMDTDLWQLPSSLFRTGSQLPRIVARSLLEALAVIEYEDGVHTDVNPNNVFLSGVNSPSPIVKLGDLGNLMGAGPMLKVRFQGVVIRAPEVWIDVQPVTPKADIWSLGLAHWLAGRMIFGAADEIIEDCVESWCIAKIMRLVGPIPCPDPSKTTIVDEFALAEHLEQTTFVHPETGIEQPFIGVGTIRQELEKVEGPIEQGCIRFIESLLIADPEKRPSAKEALQHPWLLDPVGYDSGCSVD